MKGTAFFEQCRICVRLTGCWYHGLVNSIGLLCCCWYHAIFVKLLKLEKFGLLKLFLFLRFPWANVHAPELHLSKEIFKLLHPWIYISFYAITWTDAQSIDLKCRTRSRLPLKLQIIRQGLIVGSRPVNVRKKHLFRESDCNFNCKLCKNEHLCKKWKQYSEMLY